ncbi:MAG: hypothetical protein ABJN04_08995 [Hyphomicrobiales bacterium]
MASILDRIKSARSTSISAVVLGMLAVGAMATTSAYGLTAKDGKPATEEAAPQAGEQKAPQPNARKQVREGSMTVPHLRDIVKRLDEKAQEPRPGTFLMVVNDFEVLIVTAAQANRMRIMVRVRSAENLTKEELIRISQANLDAALDARYAIGRGVLWAAYVHPLSTLHPAQFIEAIGSTVNLAATYGTAYSSGQLLYGGGDSRGIIGRKLIDQLIKKGRPI